MWRTACLLRGFSNNNREDQWESVELRKNETLARRKRDATRRKNARLEAQGGKSIGDISGRKSKQIRQDKQLSPKAAASDKMTQQNPPKGHQPVETPSGQSGKRKREVKKKGRNGEQSAKLRGPPLETSAGRRQPCKARQRFPAGRTDLGKEKSQPSLRRGDREGMDSQKVNGRLDVIVL